MRILLWHVHGSWTTAFVHGKHEYLVPVVPDRGADGRGRADTWQWPASVVEVMWWLASLVSRTVALADAEMGVTCVTRSPAGLYDICCT